MFLLNSLLGLMLSVAVSFLAVPFLKSKTNFYRYYFLITALTICCAVTLYQFSGDKKSLRLWLTEGKKHYQLQETFIKLGGIDGAISRIEKRLESNPRDAQGWLILAKLYQAKQDESNAKIAFAKAQELMNEDTKK